ncbi:MAG: SANT/Myb-like DNA-binding domain-containing protein [Leptospira sp.]|nr:SANT/Myb-like DNA-binding domain-containing protein [Leptospira sp.]
MEIDMSPDAITNRLKLMEQLWQLSINLMQAKEISETAILSETSLGKDWKKVENYVRTRSGSQVRSHAQKFFLKNKSAEPMN